MAKKEMEREDAPEIDADHAELRVYELGFHIDPELSQEEAKKVYGEIREKAASAGAIVAEGEPQKIPLAYTVSRTEQSVRRDFDASYFGWVAYEADGAGHEALLAAAKAENRIFRFIDLRTEKEAAEHAAEVHAMMKAPEQEGEPVSDAELDQALKEVGV